MAHHARTRGGCEDTAGEGVEGERARPAGGEADGAAGGGTRGGGGGGGEGNERWVHSAGRSLPKTSVQHSAGAPRVVSVRPGLFECGFIY